MNTHNESALLHNIIITGKQKYSIYKWRLQSLLYTLHIKKNGETKQKKNQDIYVWI
jgi:hypothetical protein